MKILLISDYATPTGGAEIGTLALRTELRRRGHDARLFASSAGRGRDTPSLADYECLGTTTRFRTLLQTANPWAFWKLRRVLDEFRPDVVHVVLFLTQLSPLILPLLRRRPALHRVVWYRPVCPLGTKMLPEGTPCRVHAGRACLRHRCLRLRDWLPLMFQGWLWRRWRGCFDLFVAESESIRARLEEAGIGPVRVIWEGVAPTDPRAARASLAPAPLVAFAGRLVPEKGVDVLIRAFAIVARRIADARLVLAGAGPERARLERLTAELGLGERVRMTGHIERATLESLCAQAWVQVVPSRWAEPFGYVVAEAMMRGTPVIASGSGGPAEIVRDGETGLLVPSGDVDALAEALVRLLQDRALAQRIGSAGRAFARAHLGEATCVDRLIELYHTIARPLPLLRAGAAEVAAGPRPIRTEININTA
jgi:glycosyltransferase involved in cell wall biosynthesis